jgi:chaperone LolA
MRLALCLYSIVLVLCAHPMLAIARGPVDFPGKPDLAQAASEAAKSVSHGAPAITGVDEKYAPDIARVEAYLSGLNSVVANFSQTSADGSAGTGKFFMKRPGKMRWQYAPPTPLLLVSDGKVVTYYDAGLDQVTYIGVDDTLAGFLARKDIKLESESTRLTKFEAVDGLIRATIVQKKKPADGSLTLEFSDNPLEIKNMIAVDATGNATTVKLANAQFGPVLDDKLFVFEDPRSVNRRRNKR